jgi:GNAT superfamily N-acetyltransferase
MIEIAFLVDYPETIPTLNQWFRAQWPVYYAKRTPADIARDFYSEAKRTGLPIRLVAFADGALAGTITLRDQAISTWPQYHPGLGGLFVGEQHRSRGIGTALVKAGMQLAGEQGYKSIYTATTAARGILERLEWQHIQTVVHNDEPLALYQYKLEARGLTRPSIGTKRG